MLVHITIAIIWVFRVYLIYSINGNRVSTKDQVADFVAKHGGREPLRFELRKGGGNGSARVVEISPIMR